MASGNATATVDRSLQPTGIAVSPREKFREYLNASGMRMTAERQIVVDAIFSSHEHFDADQLIERLRDRPVSRSTIYRSLKELDKAGLIRKVARRDDREIWEHDYGYPQHDHFICQSCGELIEFQNESINKLLSQVAQAHGFRMEGHRLEAYGLCAECSRPPDSRPSKLNLL